MAWLSSLVRLEASGSWVPYMLVCLALTLGLFYFFKRQHKVWLIDQIPGPKTLPLFGNALEFINLKPNEVFKLLMGRMCDYGETVGMSRMWIGTTPICFIFNAKGAEVILSSQKYIDKSNDYTFLRPWLGNGLLTSTGRKWHRRRKMLTPTFHFKILEDFMEVFNQQSAKMVNKLEAKADGTPFDIFKIITPCTLDIILETAMGRSVNAQDDTDSDYVKAVCQIAKIVQQRQLRPWIQPNLLFKLFGYAKEQEKCLKILHGFSYEMIKERRKAYKEHQNLEKSKEKNDEEVFGKRKRLAFLDLLLKSSEETDFLSDEDIREEVDTFMFEGHDTTAAAINWSIYLLGCHPEIQQKVFDEMDAIFGDSDRPATMADLREMKVLECCIKESLRIFPSVPFIGRELQEDVVIDGYKIPTGTTIWLIMFRIHRDPVQFPDPEIFNPDRFLPENCLKRHPYAYIPFSAGPRNCIGQKFAQMEEKVVLSSFFRKYRVESTVKREDLSILGELIMRPEDGNIVKVYARK